MLQYVPDGLNLVSTTERGEIILTFVPKDSQLEEKDESRHSAHE